MTILRLMTLTAFGVLCLTPVACVLGVLSHACPCESAASCGHESACMFDPCNAPLVLVTGGQRQVIQDQVAPFSLGSSSALVDLAIVSAREQPHAGSLRALLSPPSATITPRLLC